MIVEEATEILKTLTRRYRPRLNQYERDAVKLGMEALERVKANRKGPIVVVYKELPGETKGET